VIGRDPRDVTGRADPARRDVREEVVAVDEVGWDLLADLDRRAQEHRARGERARLAVVADRTAAPHVHARDVLFDRLVGLARAQHRDLVLFRELARDVERARLDAAADLAITRAREVFGDEQDLHASSVSAASVRDAVVSHVNCFARSRPFARSVA